MILCSIKVLSRAVVLDQDQACSDFESARRLPHCTMRRDFRPAALDMALIPGRHLSTAKSPCHEQYTPGKFVRLVSVSATASCRDLAPVGGLDDGAAPELDARLDDGAAPGGPSPLGLRRSTARC
ncbi:unnamed protein product [Prorocentrum cordatum]|uniref:Uncharacterized protein n=1 Tax=Prorocentrum cordatum TaxID=2364126 RepID=A0ABN9T4L8_9DINO|nr:unnamed protein product [Polarella glacialis]